MQFEHKFHTENKTSGSHDCFKSLEKWETFENKLS